MFYPQAIHAMVPSACALASLPGRLFCHVDACGSFHRSSISSIQNSTSQARAQQRTSMLRTACFAQSSSVIRGSLASLSMTRFGQPADL